MNTLARCQVLFRFKGLSQAEEAESPCTAHVAVRRQSNRFKDNLLRALMMMRHADSGKLAKGRVMQRYQDDPPKI